MVARDDRLRRNSDFDRVRSKGRNWSTRAVVLVMLENDLGRNRYGFAVGKRVGGAVERNRAKRLLREVVRAQHAALKPGYDIVLIARNSFGDSMTLRELDEQVSHLFRRSGLIETGADSG